MLIRYLQSIFISCLALAQDPHGSYSGTEQSYGYLKLVYTFSNGAEKVKIGFSCGSGARPTERTFPVTKKEATYYEVQATVPGSLTPTPKWKAFLNSFTQRCPKYANLEGTDLVQMDYDEAKKTVLVTVSGIDMTLKHE